MDIEEMKKKALLFTDNQEYNQYGIPIKHKDIELAEAKLVSNSAFAYTQEAQRVEKQIKQIQEYQAQKDAAIIQAAENSGAQVELLENQLSEVKKQNELLQENNKTLKELYEKVKEEAAENKAAAEEARKDAKKSARKATVANWFAGLSLFVSIASIIFTVLTALEVIPLP